MGVTTETKTCPGCGEDKPLAEYHKRSDRPGGVQSRCKTCTNKKPPREPAPPGTKWCTTCDEAKPLSEFTKRAASKDGLYPQCTPCKSTIQKAQAKLRAEKREAEGYQPPDRKTCTICKRVKPLEEFHKNPTSKSGRVSACKPCAIKAAAEVAEVNTQRYIDGGCETPDVKTCTVCLKTKSAAEFSMRKASKDGLSFRCMECDASAQREHYAENAEHELEQRRQWVHDNPEKAYLIKRKSELKNRYNLTPEGFEAILASQGGACAICKDTEPGGRNWHIDHDHNCCPGVGSCGKCIAGILCTNCNTGIGQLRDDPLLVFEAFKYLERTRGTR